MNIQELTQKFEQEIKKIDQSASSLDWNNRENYLYWLSQTYYFVRHTTRLLSLAAANFTFEEDKLHRHAIHHLGEEVGHEKMVLNDLKKLGVSIEDYPMLPATKKLIDSQYKTIESRGAVSHLGYSLCLEGAAKYVAPEFLKPLIGLYGEEGTLFIRSHVELDEDHFDDGIKELSSLPEESLNKVGENLEEAVKFYTQIFQEISAKTQGASLQKTS